MIDAILIPLLATVLRVDGPLLHVDKGLIDGVRSGDVGTLVYELRVAGETKAVEVGTGTVTGVSAAEAVVELEGPGERDARPGYRVRFELPTERRWASDFFATVSELDDEEETRAALGHWLDREVPHNEAVESLLLELLEERAGAAASADLPSPGLLVEAGLYRVGIPTEQATHYDQQPAFFAHLAPFRIDATAAPGSTGLSWADAAGACAERDMRLPTEIEWEVATTTFEGFELAPLYEWTLSWYEPYPGNEIPAEEYGRRYRVLRGSVDPSEADPRSRRFAAPDTEHPFIGFRCAASVP